MLYHSSMARRFGVLLTLGAVLGACGDDVATATDDAPLQDAPGTKPCWELVDPIARGVGILGTGYDRFEPLPTDLPLEFGSQNGFNVVANVQMRGLAPGNPDDIFDPSNPRTRILAFFADTGVPLRRSGTCPFRVGYKPVDGSTYEFSAGVPIIFDTCWRAEQLIGHQLRIKLEIFDSAGGYVTDERLVTAAAPTMPGYPTDEGSAGCPP